MHAQKLRSAHRRLERYNELSPVAEDDYLFNLSRAEVEMKKNVTVDCGWGKLIFGQTYKDHQALIDELADEKASCRDIAMYTRNHHVLLSLAPELLFVDPSDTFRLLKYTAAARCLNPRSKLLCKTSIPGYSAIIWPRGQPMVRWSEQLAVLITRKLLTIPPTVQASGTFRLIRQPGPRE